MNQDFKDLREKVREKYPELQVKHGGTGPEGTAERIPRPRPTVPPVKRLLKFIEKNGLKLIDFFNSVDADHSMNVTREEFKNGIIV